MLHQVHEMLYIEKGGAAQIADELAAYNPLIPQGSELVATVMFEIDDPIRRARVLASLGGIEDKAFLRDRRRDDPRRAGGRPGTHARGRQGLVGAVPALSLHARPQIAAFRGGAGDVIVGFDHPNYGHMAVMPTAVRQALAHDFA